MFSANAISSLPISDDGKSPRTFRGSVILYLNKATLTFALSFNKINQFNLAFNTIGSFVLSLNKVHNYKLMVNNIVNHILKRNTEIDFSQRR